MKKLSFIIATTLLLAGFSGCSEYDDSDLWNNVNDLTQRVQTLEEKVSQMNNEIGAMQILVNALDAGKWIVGEPVETATGYTITFNDGTTVTLRHGNDGAPGADAPVIGVDEEGGVYYWTITTGNTTAWLLNAQQEKLPVSGTMPVIGVDAGGYWTVNGVQVPGADDQPVKASGEGGDSFFSDVSQDENAVTFTLANGTVIVIPKAGQLSITTNAGSVIFLKYGESATYSFTLTGEANVSIAKPDGWRAAVQGGTLTVTAPPVANTYAEKDGKIDIIAAGRGTTIIKSFTVSARDYNYIIDFEDARVADYLAGPTSKGENLYDGSYFGYDDQPTGLFMLPTNTSSYGFASGGIAISQWNDMTKGPNPSEWWLNQCSVYYSDPVTGKGGYRGSNTFAVHYGYYSSYWDGRTQITFDDNSKECIFDHFYVTNNTYAVLSMTYGDGFAKAHSYTNGYWLKLVIEGIAGNGSTTGTVEFYLSDFRTPASPGLLTEWTPVDLSPLGKVTAIRFDLQGCDDTGAGLNTPAYFCFDNLAVRQ